MINTAKMNKFMQDKQTDPTTCNTLDFKYIDKPVTILLGPNGSGKSTTLKELAKVTSKYKVLSFSRTKDDAVLKGAPAFGNYRPDLLIAAFQSEGERIVTSFESWANETLVPELVKNQTQDYLILLDELDSGLSIDRIMKEVRLIKTIVLTEHDIHKRQVKFVISANSYELVDLLKIPNTDFIDIFWLPTLDKIKLDKYSDFRSLYVNYYTEMFRD